MRSPAPELPGAAAARLLAFALLSVILAGAHADTLSDLAERLDPAQEVVEVDGVRLHDAEAVRRFYRRRDFRPAWTGPACQADMERLIGFIDTADSHGLEPEDYHLETLRDPVRCEADREILATDAWLALGAHLHGGRLDPINVEPNWTAIRPDIDLVEQLEAALDAVDVDGALERLAPSQPFYAALREALARYRGYAAGGGWGSVDDGPLLRLGDEGPRVLQLRRRLEAGGLVEPVGDDGLGLTFDADLDAALRTFQRRANLESDGVVGPQTLRQLNRGVDDRIAQIRVNLERWRWLPEDLGERHIRVNIADFRLEARAHGRVEREHAVIVGREYRQTPSFSARMTYVALSPWWEVPVRLAVQDKLPLFRRDPGEIDRLGFEFVDASGQIVDPAGIDLARLGRGYFPYRLRQQPGPQNALGQVKLMFPNQHHVYLHDTPSQGLFARVRRDFSSGCIRVEDALDLAEWVLAATPGWDHARIDAAAGRGEETVVLLAQPIDVHLYYITAVPAPDGGVRFIDDLYGRDPAVLAALDAPPTR
ncbi:MAG TPA: L,D-transpeptidase family protein [Xanthomonadaceae bacterium]|nr:L,D-transpeptidase family protein [Xanthomonadaceae bacterium]